MDQGRRIGVGQAIQLRQRQQRNPVRVLGDQVGRAAPGELVDQAVGDRLHLVGQLELVDAGERFVQGRRAQPVLGSLGMDRAVLGLGVGAQGPVVRHQMPAAPVHRDAAEELGVRGDVADLAVAEQEPGRHSALEQNGRDRAVVAPHLAVQLGRVALEPGPVQGCGLGNRRDHRRIVAQPIPPGWRVRD